MFCPSYELIETMVSSRLIEQGMNGIFDAGRKESLLQIGWKFSVVRYAGLDGDIL